jgi:hypothetical protein
VLLIESTILGDSDLIVLITLEDVLLIEPTIFGDIDLTLSIILLALSLTLSFTLEPSDLNIFNALSELVSIFFNNADKLLCLDLEELFEDIDVPELVHKLIESVFNLIESLSYINLLKFILILYLFA